MATAIATALARRAIAETLIDVLVGLDDEETDGITDEELAAVEDALESVADLVLDALDLTILDVASDGTITATLKPPTTD